MMKKYIKPLVLILTLPGLMLSSCRKFGDTNIDPTRSSNLDPALQLSYVQVRYSGDLEVNEKLSVVMTMPLVQQIGGIWANRYGQFYIKSTPYLYSLWEYTYGLDVLNIVDAVTRTTGDPAKTNMNAVCRIMKVYEFARLTDIYGDIPYSEAGKAFSDGITKPKFDTQEAIYNDFFKELKEAAEQLDVSKDPVKGDMFYNGDIAAWKKFANSLRLRYAMRLVKRDPIKAQAEAEAAFNAGVFTSNADICKIVHEDIQNSYADIRGNGISSAFAQAEVIPRLTNTFINQLRTTNDPRIKHLVRYYVDIINRPQERVDITDPVVAQIGYNGVNPKSYVWDDWMNPITIEVPGQGTMTAVNNDQKAQLPNFMIRNDAPYLHMTYAEVELLLADAAVRFGVNWGGSATDHYKKGVEAAMQQLSLFPGGPIIPSGEITTFLNGNSLTPGSELEIINTQLWVTLLMNGPEAYANWRRSGFPELTPSVTQESTVTTIPRRFEYSLNETEQNATNVAEAVDRLGGNDDWTKRVWWDKE